MSSAPFRRSRSVKRLLDLSLALPLAVAAAPFICLFAIAIKLASRGPAFFVQEREGRGGKPIRVYKLRTMHHRSEHWLAQYLHSCPATNAMWLQCYKLRDDPRVIRGIGELLRRYSLDELPQLWNVLKGDMSLVGPRPFPEYHLNGFPEAFRGLRASVMPGMTGLWQVSSRSDGNLKTQEAEDTYYIRNWSVRLDVNILLRTVKAIIAPRGAY